MGSTTGHRLRIPPGAVAAAAFLIATALAPASHAALELSLAPPQSPLAAGETASFAVTASLDCQTALLWSGASGGALGVTVAVTVGPVGLGMQATGPTALTMPIDVCQDPRVTTTTGTGTAALTAGLLSPALADVGAWVRVVLPAAGPSGQSIVAEQAVNHSVTVRIKPELRMTATSNSSTFDVTAPSLHFAVQLRNLGNVPLEVAFNTTAQASIEAPIVRLGSDAVPGSGPSNATGDFLFHAPPGSWTQATAHLVIVPQLQTSNGTLHGPPEALDFLFLNKIPKEKNGAAAGPAVALCLLGAALLARRRLPPAAAL